MADVHEVPITHLPSRLVHVEYKSFENGDEWVRVEIMRKSDMYAANENVSDDEIREALTLAGLHLGVKL